MIVLTVRDENRRQAGSFEIIVGKSIVEDGGAECFAFVNREDAKPKRRLFEVLKAHGLQPNQQLMFLSDGGDTVRDLQMYLSPESEHWLDWFHITIRLTVMGQYVKGLAAELPSAGKKPVQPDGDEPDEPIDAADIAQRLERLKWNLWHGNVRRALQVVDLLEEDLEIDGTHFAPAKGAGQWNTRLRIDEAGIGTNQCLGADVVLLDPLQASQAQRRIRRIVRQGRPC